MGIDTNAVREYWRKNIDLICSGALNEIVDLCDELDNLRKPAEGLKRPAIESIQAGNYQPDEHGLGLVLMDVCDYALALEAALARRTAELAAEREKVEPVLQAAREWEEIMPEDECNSRDLALLRAINAYDEM